VSAPLLEAIVVTYDSQSHYDQQFKELKELSRDGYILSDVIEVESAIPGSTQRKVAVTNLILNHTTSQVALLVFTDRHTGEKQNQAIGYLLKAGYRCVNQITMNVIWSVKEDSEEEITAVTYVWFVKPETSKQVEKTSPVVVTDDDLRKYLGR
jgi:hypothetical protein